MVIRNRVESFGFQAINVTALLDTLTPHQLQNLKRHKYAASGKSLIEPLFVPWWNFAITLCPLWIAPNMITFLGFLVNLQAFLIAVYYCGLEGLGEAPRWVYFNLAGSLFVYQTMDAIDGKQARRTGTGSPLGELFDHGLDCIANAFFLPSMLMCLQAGKDLDKFNMLSFSCFFVFYCSHWVHYVVGKLTFGLIDITEIQTSTMGLFIVTGIFGPQYWDWNVPLLPITNRDLVVYGSLAICAFGFVRMMIAISAGGCGPNNSSNAGTSILSPGPNIILQLGIGLIVGTKTNLIYDHPVLFNYFTAILSAKTTHKLVVANMTKAAIRVADPALWNVMAIGVNQYLDSYLPHDTLFFILVGYATFDLIRFCVRTYTQIADSLGIQVLTIPKEKQKLI